ncbi:sporulation protein YabP [Desulfovirgula thermocuniculi]|uniref:sporulation protein YabP n=1 Tax=Desulfovirgula thermocuniculi TaxID=348842 RepID=UPI001B7FA7BD|nr:sporulation protein YabP [Desulfovirgula thermocuniculi]
MRPVEGSHRITLLDRKQLHLEGVRHVESFDEREIVLDTTLGALTLKGEGLHITRLDLEKGVLSAEGYFASLVFQEGKGRAGTRGRNLLARLIK